MTNARTTAVTALREAASALGAGRAADGADGQLPDGERAGVAGEVAHVLDALIALLRTIDRDAETTGSAASTNDLDPVLAHLASGVTLARSVQDRGPHQRSGDHDR
ncbi:hypothetical protein [Actinomycetospora sp. TBRC 11914]|uniref:hypothetical protein n=1 Tax=Actinomycetospora sp. TBRC 11914 TaxID=2729387 RepID=UPI00145C7C7B|nr:hypothetical protein [Actinomycetospora sp. TBRC 11914]NMO94076.1 hypothetical protein [Actinomycetospora sp. TBRC 11914]